MGIGSSKEGVSVYGLLQRCVTGMVGLSAPLTQHSWLMHAAYLLHYGAGKCRSCQLVGRGQCTEVSVVCVCQGRRLLRQWFLRPVVQLDVIADRHDTLDLLVAAPTTNDALRAAMKKVGGVVMDFECSIP